VVDGSSHTYASGATYDAAGQLTGLSHQYATGNPVYTRTLQYNNRLQMSSIVAQAGSTTIQNLGIGFGAAAANNGNIMSITNGLASGRNETFSYDQLNRLQQAYDTHWGETYTYDPWGNMYQRAAMSGHAGHTWTLTGPFPKNQLPNMAYDAAGEVTTDNNSYTYTYDGEGRIVTAGAGSYLYDGDGNRVMKTVSGTTTLYWPGMRGVADESNATGTAFGKQIAFGGLKLWSEDTAGTGRFLFQDQLGSTRVTADASGTVHDDIDYYPFGDVYNNYGVSPSDNHYLFTGDENDAESKTDFAHARNLSGSMARFHRPDPYDGSYNPSNPQTLNRYVYALNNPLAFSDPSGLVLCDWGHSDVTGGDDFDNDDDCAADGGSPVDEGSYVSVTADGSDEFGLDTLTWSTGSELLDAYSGPGGPNNQSPCYKPGKLGSVISATLTYLSLTDGVGHLFGARGGIAAGMFSAELTQAFVSDANGNVGLMRTVTLSGGTSVGFSAYGGLSYGVSDYLSLDGYAGLSSQVTASGGDEFGGSGSFSDNTSGFLFTVTGGGGYGASLSSGPSYTWVTPLCH
jgi:RHS repeat-associated protein